MYHLARGRGRFCSLKCAGVEQSLKMSGSNHPGYIGLKCKCKNCGKEFKTAPSSNSVFCSQKCFGENISKNQTGNKNHNWEGGPEIKTCQHCGKDFKIVKALIKNGGGKFCSRKCLGMWRHTNLSGNRSYAWRGGITDKNLLIRSGFYYKKWRLNVFIRDSYTCRHCGQVGGKLHAHHIKRFSVILNDIRQKFPLLSVDSVAENYKDLWDVQNGETLCEKCHKAEHKKGGYK